MREDNDEKTEMADGEVSDITVSNNNDRDYSLSENAVAFLTEKRLDILSRLEPGHRSDLCRLKNSGGSGCSFRKAAPSSAFFKKNRSIGMIFHVGIDSDLCIR